MRLVFATMRERGIGYEALEERSGVRRAAFKAWRTKNKPSLESLSAVLGALGWSYLPVPVEQDALPPEMAAELGKIAERFGITYPEVTTALVEIVAGRRAA